MKLYIALITLAFLGLSGCESTHNQEHKSSYSHHQKMYTPNPNGTYQPPANQGMTTASKMIS